MEPTLRTTLLPKDTNGNGSIFGGVILSYIDLAGAVEASRHTNHKIVTVAMDKVVFKKPVFVGDLISFYTDTLSIGTKSVTVQVTVRAMRHKTGEVVDVTEAQCVFVAINDNNESVPLEG